MESHLNIPIVTLIQRNKLKSQRSYVDALKAFQKGAYDISLIKAYSAGFSAAEAILLAHNYIAPSKRDILNRFGHLRAMEPVMEKLFFRVENSSPADWLTITFLGCMEDSGKSMKASRSQRGIMIIRHRAPTIQKRISAGSSQPMPSSSSGASISGCSS